MVMSLGLIMVVFVAAWAMAADAPVSQGKTYMYNVKPPHSAYPDESGGQLTDGIVASENVYWDTKWVGVWIDQPWIVTIDLGASMPITQLRSHHLAGTAGIWWPTSISVSVSENGATWSEPVELVIDEERPDAAVSDWFVVGDLNVQGRWVMITYGPPSGGGNMFVSEIEVY